MSTQIKEAPVSERPGQENSTTKTSRGRVGNWTVHEETNSKREEIAFEALCAGLTRAGKKYRGNRAIVHECMDALREAGLLGKSLREVITPIDSAASARASVFIFEHANEDAWVEVPRSREKAQALALAIRAEYGGTITERSNASPYVFYVTHCALEDDVVSDIEHVIYYTPEHEAKESAGANESTESDQEEVTE